MPFAFAACVVIFFLESGREAFRQKKRCHDRLSLRIVINHRAKYCWSDSCRAGFSSKIGQSSTEVMGVFNHCHQRLPTVLLQRWLSLQIVIKGRPLFYWSNGYFWTLSSKVVIKEDCHNGFQKFYWSDGCVWLLNVLLKWWLSQNIVDERLLKVLLKWWLSETLEKKIKFPEQNRLKNVKIYFFCLEHRHRTCGFAKPLLTSCLSDAQNCGKTKKIYIADRPFRHFARVGRSQLW